MNNRYSRFDHGFTDGRDGLRIPYEKTRPLNKNTRWPMPKKYSLEEARKYAQRIMPGIQLDYIPQIERDIVNWVDNKVYHDPTRGSLTWCHPGAPRTKAALKRTMMYVMDKQVGSNVDAVASAAKQQRRKEQAQATKWEEDQDRAWEVSSKVQEELTRISKLKPAPYWGKLEEVGDEMMFDLITNKMATLENFKEWLNIKPTKEAEDWGKLGASMESLAIAEKEWDEWENEKKVEEAINTELLIPEVEQT